MGYTVLIIDDSKSVRQQILNILSNADLFSGYLEATNGIEGFKILLNEKVDIVLCDVEMPGMDGFKFLSMVNSRKELQDIPVLLLTSHEDVATKVRGLEQGASDYVTKPFSPEELLARVKVQLKIKTLQDHLKESNQQLRTLSQTDPLTGLYNRRHMMTTLESELDRSNRISSPFSLLMIDLDHFKRINDTYGHQQGDRVLQSISQEIQAQLRQYDSAARFGGEEFALLLPETNLSEGTMVAERLRQIISKIQFSDSISDLKITASIGIAAIPHKKINSTEDLIRLADNALYAAKSNGRNRVETPPSN
ncbi:MAG: diguanylate cyclase [Desulfuromonadales bacterium]|nr:diguanylate cyclase [Desulfuromonadales bacterium]